MSFKFVTSDDQSNIYAVTDTGDLLYYHDEARDGTSQWSFGNIGQNIGHGWGGFLDVFSGGDGIIYAIATNGDLLYFRDEARNGTYQWAYGGIGQNIGGGFNAYAQVFSGGDGIIYAIATNGDLLYFRDEARNGTSQMAYGGIGQRIGNGWGNFRHVISGGGGIIYAVTRDGDLLYYRDEARDGTRRWSFGEIGKEIGQEWDLFPAVFFGGDGVIYAITADGSLLFYRDQARNGTGIWAYGGIGQPIGSDWFITQQVVNVEGYCTPLSIAPGEILEFRVSAKEDYAVTYVRLKQQDDGSIGLSLTDAIDMGANLQSTPEETWKNGCGWQTSFTLEIPVDWQSGMYAAQCTDSDGNDYYIVFIVKPNPEQRANIAVLANTNTWNAYNTWGGRSKYTEVGYAAVGSFERPSPYTTPIDDNDINHLTRSELWILNWLEDSGYQIDLYSDYDFHSGIDEFVSYKALILTTHPEYWTVQMLDNLEQYLSTGGNLLYLGGNGLFEQCKYIYDDAALQFFRGDPSQGRDRNYFRNLGRPEREILGVGTLLNNWIGYCKPAPYKVKMAEHPFFIGTGLVNEDLIGQAGLNRRTGDAPELGAASGWEMDTSDGAIAPDNEIVNAYIPGYPIKDEDGNVKFYGSDRGNPPDNIQLLARGTNEPVQGPHAAHMTYYDTDNGGFVFSVGSICFGGSLALDANLQIIVKNALNDCLK